MNKMLHPTNENFIFIVLFQFNKIFKLKKIGEKLPPNICLIVYLLIKQKSFGIKI